MYGCGRGIMWYLHTYKQRCVTYQEVEVRDVDKEVGV